MDHAQRFGHPPAAPQGGGAYTSWLVGVILTVIALPACGKDGESTESKPSKAAPGRDITAPTLDWPQQPLTRVQDAVDGVEFSLELPPKLVREEKKGDDTFPGYVTWNARNFLTNPGFTVQITGMPPANVEEAARMAAIHPQPATVITKENLPGNGFMVTMHENTRQFMQVQAWRTSAKTSKVVSLSIGLRHGKAIEPFDAMRAWMEKVARSFRVK